MIRSAAVLCVLSAVVALSGCTPLENPGSTSQIQLVSTTTQDGWKWDQYRNLAYPCSISGYQTFVVGTKVGSSDAAARPLWVRMRGGGVGFFSADGRPQPSAGNKSEETAQQLIDFSANNALNDLVSADAAGFRNVSVSMCNHDIYAGGVQPDPYNPNTTPDGKPRTVNGLFATKAAVRFVQEKYPTTKTFLHGTSAGSFGTWGVAWGLQKEGRPVAGSIADSGVLNQQYEADQNAAGTPCARGTTAINAIKARTHPQLGKPENQPDQLIARRELTAPVFNVYSRDDGNSCGETQISCTLPDGSKQTLGGMVCKMLRIDRAIQALPASARSRFMQLCVRAASGATGTCGRHVVTGVSDFPNTDPRYPADYNAEIMSWVRQRLAD